MNNIITQEVYLPITDNVESPYSVYVWTGIDPEKSFVTAVERKTDVVVITKEEFDKILRDAVDFGRAQCKTEQITNPKSKTEYINSLFK